MGLYLKDSASKVDNIDLLPDGVKYPFSVCIVSKVNFMLQQIAAMQTFKYSGGKILSTLADNYYFIVAYGVTIAKVDRITRKAMEFKQSIDLNNSELKRYSKKDICWRENKSMDVAKFIRDHLIVSRRKKDFL